jgi:hypothetical protein
MLMSFLEIYKMDCDRAKAYDLAMKMEAAKRQTDERNAMGQYALDICKKAGERADAFMRERVRNMPGYERQECMECPEIEKRMWVVRYHFFKRLLMGRCA